MIKIGIISRHAVANYGSILQAYALETVVRQLGYDAFTINYVNDCEQGKNLAYTLANKKNNFLKRILFLLYQVPSFGYTYKKFKKYRKCLLNQTKLYSSVKELKSTPPVADIYCTGSDQVWNVISNGILDPAYFLDFGSKNIKRIAYAASFGGKEVLKNHKTELLQMLTKYDKITVRENNGVEVLTSIGCDGQCVLDPTLLLDNSHWIQMSGNKALYHDYILVYQLKPSKIFDQYVKNIKQKTGKKIIRVSAFLYQIIKCGRFIYTPSPEVVLNLINNASLVITDSFHATAFSINMETDFVEILPGKFNTRNTSLLELFGLENRIITNPGEIDIINKKIDFIQVRNKLKKERQKSINLLNHMCSGEEI